MRYQPPDNNNPANPLLKVAALNIDRSGEDSSSNQARIIINLTFKRSNDLRGKTRTTDGQPVTVVFGLALARASLRLTATTDAGRSANGLARIEKVAFVNPLALKTSVSNDETVTRDKSAKLEISAAAQINSNSGVPSASVGAQGGANISGATKKKRRISTKFSKTNVVATFAGNEVHWEINPSVTDVEDQALIFLEGDVFRAATGGRNLDACVISRKDGASIANLVITGSVFVNMNDLILSEVSFLDELGTQIEASKIQHDVEQPISLKERIFRDDVKKRLVRQIIRKHLISQGMTTDGSLVEICRGET